jgi:carbon starvation protein CstA
MSKEETSTWIYAVVAILVPTVYFTNILEQVASTPVARIEYVGPMLWAIGAAILASIVANIFVGMFSSKESGRRDERDQHIGRLGFIFGFFVFSIMMVVPLVMAMAEVPHFWIANTIYLAFTLTAFAYSALKIVAYRRGL